MDNELRTPWQKIMAVVLFALLAGTLGFCLRYLPILFDTWLSLSDKPLAAFTIFIFLVALGTVGWLLFLFAKAGHEYLKATKAERNAKPNDH